MPLHDGVCLQTRGIRIYHECRRRVAAIEQVEHLVVVAVLVPQGAEAVQTEPVVELLLEMLKVPVALVAPVTPMSTGSADRTSSTGSTSSTSNC